MKIDALMLDPGASIFYDAGFRNVLEDHLPYLKTLPSTVSVTIDIGKAYRFEHDFFGLCAEYRVPAHLHWLVMRMNGMTSPTDFVMGREFIIVPDNTVIERIRQAHMTSRKIT